jgi:hypothetical protein
MPMRRRHPGGVAAKRRSGASLRTNAAHSPRLDGGSAAWPGDAARLGNFAEKSTTPHAFDTVFARKRA